ncbi:MAG: serine hydrolase domain-containing protein [Bacteroidota bacterium]
MSKIITKILTILVLALSAMACENEIQRPSVLVCPLDGDTLYHGNSKSSEFRALLESYVKRGLPGAILLVKDSSGFFTGAAGMADIEHSIPMQVCHISKIASVTKFMLGVSVLRLQEKGILSLDDPIRNYISGDKLDRISNGNESLTVRNLMNHTSGLYDVIDDNGFYLQVLNNPSKHWTSGDLLKYVTGKDAAFDFRPADTAGYSNTNYLLLSMVMEAASSLPHGAALHNEVIDLLHLDDTYYFWHDPLPGNGIAQGYYDLYNNGNLENLTQWNTGSGNGYGGVYSTVWDMYKFIDALFVQKTLLNQTSLNEMLVFHPDVESRKLLGVSCFKDFIDIGDPEKDYAWGHRGRDLSYSADLYYFPEHGATMALIVNYGTDGDSPLRPVFNEMRDKIAKLIVSD